MTEQTKKDIDRAFKALEERDELLDKIRAEIESIYKEDMECDGCSDMGMVLDIIDKYAEQEPQERSEE